jgi:hypothetical protein
MVWLDWAHGLIDPIKRRLKSALRMFAKRASRTLRLIWRIRRSTRAPRPAT